MSVKKTQVLAEELEIISGTLQSNYCREVLKESAERLRDLEKIAEFYLKQANEKRGKNDED